MSFMILIVSIVAFCVPMLGGEDPARTILLANSTSLDLDPDRVEAMRKELGLDQPLVTQYLNWLGNAVQGDFGKSFANRQPVGDEIMRALGVSVTLALSALGVALLIALPLGTAAAMNPGGRLDSFTTLLIQTLVATPEYWFAPVSVLFFVVWLGFLQSAGWTSWESVVLPAMALSLRPTAYFTQVTRAAMLDVLEARYITAARARGLSLKQAVVFHGIRNGSLPVVTFFALWFAGLLGGAVVIEVIFGIPGMGRLLYEAVVNNDIPVLQGAFVSIVGLSILINTAADVGYLMVNPVMRSRGGS
ncbi:MAG: ABC transporter permease [Pseudomonadota bacterium]